MVPLLLAVVHHPPVEFFGLRKSVHGIPGRQYRGTRSDTRRLAMDVAEAIASRRTIRGFKSDPVDEDLIRRIFEQAQRAPSNCNTQPWHVTVVSGAARDRLEKMLLHELSAGKQPSPAFRPGDADLAGEYRARQIDCAVRYYSIMGIAREDRDARNELMARNW